MEIINFVLIILAILTAGISIFLAFQMVKAHQANFLFFFSYYILFHNILGLIRMASEFMFYFQPTIFSIATYQKLDIYLTILFFPLIPIGLYFFIRFIGELLEQDFPRRLKKIYSIFWIFAFLLFLNGYIRPIKGNDHLIMDVTNFTVNLAIAAIILFSLLYLLFKSNQVKIPQHLKPLKQIGYFYLTSYALVLFVSLIAVNHLLVNQIITFLFLAMNLPVIFIIKKKIVFTGLHLSHHLPNDEKLQQLYTQHKISSREQEIVNLILKGKSNKDIENDMFISLKTVKNHIYNIYKKFGIRNRVQLINLIHKTFGQ